MTDRVQELRELEEAATPGPWEPVGTSTGCIIAGPGRYYVAGDVDAEDGNLIIAARNALPDLLDIAEAAQTLALAVREYFTPNEPAEHFEDALAQVESALAKLDGGDQ